MAWLDQQWGAQVALRATFALGGWLALALLRASLVAAGLTFVFLACRARGVGRRMAALLTFASVFVARPSLQLRPQLFGIVCFASVAWLLAGRREHPARIWLAVPVTVVWVNLHGSFFLAPVLVGLATLEELRDRPARNRLLLLVAATGLATLVDPFAWRVWGYVFDLARNPVVRQVVEWRPPTVDSYAGAVFFLSVAIVGVIIARAGTPTPWPALGSLGVFFVLGLASVRGAVWWGLAAPIVLAGTPVIQRFHEREHDPRNVGNTLIVASLVVATLLFFSRWLPYSSQSPVPEHLVSEAPFAMTRELAGVLAPGEPFFNAQIFGSWFEYALPDNPVGFDSRIELIPEAEWHQYDDVSDGKDGWEQILSDWGLDVLALSSQQQENLIGVLETSDGWVAAYRGSDGEVWVRR
jgi:hypothetical protein